MRILPVLLVIMILLCTCSQPEQRSVAQLTYQTINYVTVGKMMDTVKVPYVIDVSHGNKRVVLIGCDHSHDTLRAQFQKIQRYFNDLKPQIAFNEGGQIADTLHFVSVNDGGAKDGETGVMKYLSDRSGIKLMDGDITDSLEFAITLKRYPKDDLLLYYIMERLVIPQLSGAYGDHPFEELYNKAINKWFVQRGFPLAPQQRTLAYFKQLYKKNTGHDFELKVTPDVEKFDYVNGGDCKFCAIGRASKMLRDSVLLSKIDNALNTHDRVMVTFGHGHAIAIKPALKQIVNRH